MAEEGPFRIEREGGRTKLVFDVAEVSFYPSLEDSSVCMRKVMNKLIETGSITTLVLSGTRNWVYPHKQIKLLNEIREAYLELVRRKKVARNFEKISEGPEAGKKLAVLRRIVYERLKGDPVGAFLKTKRELRHSKMDLRSAPTEGERKQLKEYIRALRTISRTLESKELIKRAKSYLAGYKIGNRDVYRKIFEPEIKPNFMYTKMSAAPPREGESIDSYEIGEGVEVTIYDMPGTERMYHVVPPEFQLKEEELSLLARARSVLAKYKPKEEEFVSPERMREVFFNISKDMLESLVHKRGLEISYDRIEKLAKILVRLTVGFGVTEVLLKDEDLEDVYINAPIGKVPIIVKHAEYGEMKTNLTPNIRDAKSWASRFRMLSGRPLDEANPVLDTELFLPETARVRVAIIQQPLSPKGHSFAFRRHRKKPWTYPLYIDNNYLSPLAAGLLWFLIEGNSSMLVAGTRGAGKTSLLGANLLEIMRKYRIITIEDSVTGDSRVLVKRNGKVEKTKIGKLVDDLIKENKEEKKLGRKIIRRDDLKDRIEVLSMNSNGKTEFREIRSFIKHEVEKPIYEVETRTGRKLKVTGDHSLFTIGENQVLKEVKTKELEKGDYMATPRNYDIKKEGKEKICLLNHLEKLSRFYLKGKPIKNLIEKGWGRVKEIRKDLGYSKSMPSYWKRKGILPVEVFQRFEKREIKAKEIRIKPHSGGKEIPGELRLSKELLTFIGLWIADGCYDQNSVLVTVSQPELRKLVKKIGRKLNLPVKNHSDGHSLMLNSKVLKRVMREVLKLKGDAHNKEVPNWVYNLSKKQIASVLRGIFSGDGCVSKKEIKLSSASDKLLKDLQTLLLGYGIVLRRSNRRGEDGTFYSNISALKFQKKFNDKIGILTEKKRGKLKKLCSKSSTHDNTDIIPLSNQLKEELPFNRVEKHDYMKRDYNLGREKLAEIGNRFDGGAEQITKLATSDIFWDEVKEIKKVKEKGEVYDLSVPGNENFVTENILAHNTLELPTDYLRKLGYNILPMKVRSAIMGTEKEMSAAEGIRTALRLGDSCLIVGEVRSSLRGNEEVIIVENGEVKRIPIKEIEGKDYSKIKVPTLNGKNKVELQGLTDFVKHPKRKKLVRIKTRTGREVTVTEDHSVFMNENFKIEEIETDKLKKGDSILLPASLPSGYNDKDYINVMEKLEDGFRLGNYDKYLRKAIDKLGYKRASEICEVPAGNDVYLYLRSEKQRSRIEIKKFKKLMEEAGVEYDLKNLEVRRGTSKTLPAKFPITKDFCKFLGYYIAEGNISKNNREVQITNSQEELKNDIINLFKKLFDVEPYTREVYGKGESTQISTSHTPLAHLILKLGVGRVSGEKRIPSFIYGLSKEKIAAFLEGAYKGDGSMFSTEDSGNTISYSTTNKKLAEDMMYLLLTSDIVARLEEQKKEKGKDVYKVIFKLRRYVERFLDELNLPKDFMTKKGFSHTKMNSVEFDPKELDEMIDLPRKYRHLRKTGRCSKYYLRRVAKDVGNEKLKEFANGEFFLDKIKEIEEIKLEEPEHVYDLSVNPTENFIGGFGGILLHNTEAVALYEAMRVGAMANYVGGTIHGESPYGVFDRVVNDLEVPRTSFKATDIIIVANKLKSPSGLHKIRRVTNITEVRKHWEEDPLEEGGFVPLMEYDPRDDKLKPTDDLIEGNSKVLKGIAANVREWAGNWRRVWENIQLRKDIKKMIADYARKSNKPKLMEADFTVKANEKFSEMFDSLREEVGYPSNERVKNEFKKWLKSQI